MSTESDSEDISEEIADESYHDDPELLVDIPRRNILAGFAAFLMLLAGTSFYLPSTLGGKIVINSNATNIEFGQSVAQTVTCTEGYTVILTPYNTYINSAGPGTNLFAAFKISEIPAACLGNDLTLSVFDNSSSVPLTIFDSDTVPSLVATVYLSPDKNFYPVNSPNF